MTLSAVCASTTRFSRSRFTGKERDAESGNDYFEARYYSSAMGRFMSPDWSAKEDPVPYATMDDPQSLNLYSYVKNNPLSHVDADGHCCEITWNDVQTGVAVVGTAVTAAEAGVVALGAAAFGGAAYSVSQGNSPYLSNGYPTSFNLNSTSSNASSASEQGRDAQGKFLPTQAGQSKPGAAGEKEGLASEGATKNTQPIPGSNRIPDGTKADGQYVEVKSGGTVSNTGQLKEMGKAAVAATGKPLVVVTTNPNANVTKPAQQNPDLVHKPLNQ
jgi:RHS repeat-associated protein